MNESQKVLSDIVVYNKYARYIPSLGRRETWEEIVDRYLRMMIEKYGGINDVVVWDWFVKHRDKGDKFIKPNAIGMGVMDYNALTPISREIVDNGAYLYRKDVLPSMRAAQFAGIPVFRNNTRLYNCAFMPIDHKASFSEAMFLLLSGTGVGYSVQFSHVAKLPELNKGQKSQKFLIGDSIEGWADSIKALMYWAFGERKTRPEFDYSDIRSKGELLITSGGKAPGPAPLRIAHSQILGILESVPNGSKLTPLQCHDIICIIADAVLAGGIRRAALISLFSVDDEEMLNSKNGDWWESHPYRGRANNSAVLVRHRVTKQTFDELWTKVSNSYSGEPGIYFTNDANWGTNPCCEIALRPYQFCNLTEINAGSIRESVGYNTSTLINKGDMNLLYQQEFNNRARVASFFGTLQAGFTDFHYLRPIWRETTEKDALIGVGLTGIASGDTFDLDKYEASQVSVNENKRVAALIKINSAARVTTIKPSGTTSIVVGSSSGIHAWFAKYYLRSMQTAVDSDLAKYFFANHPQLIKVMDLDSKSAVIGIPQMAPEGGVLRKHEDAIQALDRVFHYYDTWVKPGHQSGANTNNVSATIFVKRISKTKKNILGWDEQVFDEDGNPIYTLNEWPKAGEYLWNNRDKFNGISVLPYDGGNYKDAPFQEITEEEYTRLLPYLNEIDLTQINELVDNTNLQSELACAGGNCEIK